MKAALYQLVAISLVIVAGAFCWTAARVQQGRVERDTRIVTLRLDGLPEDPDRTGATAQSWRRYLPWNNASVVLENRRRNWTARYWQARYDTLSQQDGRGVSILDDPALVFLAANGSYRIGELERDDWRLSLPRLDAILRSYAEVMTIRPGDLDAAYNYEYIVRLRDAITHGRFTSIESSHAVAHTPARGAPAAGASGQAATLHGRAGRRARVPDMNEFRIIIPRAGDEKASPSDVESSRGQTKRRKG